MGRGRAERREGEETWGRVGEGGESGEGGKGRGRGKGGRKGEGTMGVALGSGCSLVTHSMRACSHSAC